MSNSNARLHYIRLKHTIDKMYSTFFKSQSLKEGVDEYYNHLANTHNKYNYYDLDNILLICSISLMGLNKESTEKSLDYKDYTYHFNYSIPNFNAIVDSYMQQFNIPHQNRSKLEQLLQLRENKKYSFFTQERLYETPYQQWLNVLEENDSLPNFTYNYLSCVRDAFMHSEYLPEENPSDENNSTMHPFLPISNNDFKHFKAELFIPNFLDFIKFYYSNIAFYGLMSKRYVLETDELNIKQISSLEQLHKTITESSLHILSINNPSNNREDSIEYTSIKDKEVIFDKVGNTSHKTFESTSFTQDKKDLLLHIIKEYYGNEFYSYPKERQFQILLFITDYIHNPKSIISSGIIAIYENAINIGRISNTKIDLSSEPYCIKEVLTIIGLYTTLYRIQNENFIEINYSNMNSIVYTYQEQDPYNQDLYQVFKNKLINKGIVEEESIYQKRYITEIIRNSLAHGNIDIKFDIVDNKLQQSIVFNDIYKGKTRSLTISIDELQKYMSSDCFSRKETILKPEDKILKL